jgi:hypothetical protein
MNYSKIFIIFLTLLFIACSNEEINTIDESTLTGKVFGEDFTAAYGHATVIRGRFITVTLTTGEVNCEANTDNIPLYLSVAVPDRIGYHKNVMAVFGKSGQAPVTEFDAVVEIVEIANNQLLGRLRSENTRNNNVEGSFRVNVCQQ